MFNILTTTVTSGSGVMLGRPYRSLLGFALTIIALIAATSCGEGYRVDPAVIDVSESSNASKIELFSTTSQFLEHKGFDNLGRSDQMIALLKRQPVSKAKSQLIDRFERQITFLTPAEDLRVEWMDYADTPPPAGTLSYVPSSERFIELSIFESRPGGFSDRGKQLFDQLLADLRQRYGDAVTVVKEPPPNDKETYRRITIENTIASVFWLSFTALISLWAIGSLTAFGLKRTPLSTTARRILFTLITTWLVAPMESPTFFVVIPIPNLLLFPWTDLDYYRHFAGLAEWSFPCTLLLCTAASLHFFRGKLRTEGAGSGP